ncbi:MULTISPECIES: hypothetical protein [Aphanothece]|uniref:hypothetical protein n=1 Tax=Aphanothece TaxID=1121 RepID=UPI003984D12E
MAAFTSVDSAPEMIGALIDSFFAALKVSPDLSAVEERPAEMAYELDQVVSAFLEEHQLSAEAYHQIEQDVLNTIAADLQADHLDPLGLGFSFDADGNVDPLAVFTALDDHFDDWLLPDHSPDPDAETAMDAIDLSSGFVSDIPSDYSAS